MPEAKETVVACSGLRKTFKDFWGRAAFPALEGLDLTVRAGESYALLGPNGSGKTTTLRILLGLLEPTAGTATLFGGSPSRPEIRRRVGFLPESSTLHGFLRCDETLDLFGSLHGLAKKERTDRAAALLEKVELTDAARKRVRELSHGMRRRLALAVALMGKPELLVLDEPTAGMDPLVRERVLAMLRHHVEGGGTLLVTSHLLGDIQGIAARATLLSRGRVVREGALDDLLRRDGLREYVARGEASLDDAVSRAVGEAGGEVIEAGPARSSIEELFLDTYSRGKSDPEDDA